MSRRSATYPEATEKKKKEELLKKVDEIISHYKHKQENDEEGPCQDELDALNDAYTEFYNAEANEIIVCDNAPGSAACFQAQRITEERRKAMREALNAYRNCMGIPYPSFI